MTLVAGMLVVGIAVGIAAVFVVREAGRIARQPPPALFDTEDAFEWVVEHLPDEAAATLTVDDVRRILEFQLEFLSRKGISGNGHDKPSGAEPPSAGPPSTGPVVFETTETVAYILKRCEATGEAYLSDQVHAVIDTQFGYLRSIGAVGPPAPPLDGDE